MFSAFEYFETSCQSVSFCRSYVASGEQMHMKCAFLPSSPNGLAFARLSVLTAFLISSTVSLSLAVSASLLTFQPAYCKLFPMHIASRVTHSTTVPSCSPRSSAESAITRS